MKGLVVLQRRIYDLEKNPGHRLLVETRVCVAISRLSLHLYLKVFTCNMASICKSCNSSGLNARATDFKDPPNYEKFLASDF